MTRSKGPMHVLAVVHGRHQRNRRWLRLLELLEQEGLNPKVLVSEYSGHSLELAQKHAPKEGLVLSVGGDGTLHEVVNGWFCQADRGAPRFATLSLGTGNDVARELGLDRSPEKILGAILDGREQLLDLGHIEYCLEGRQLERCFLTSCTFGFSAEVIRCFQKQSRILPGTLQYLLTLVLTLLRWRNKSGLIETERGQQHSERFFNFNVANARFYGGGMYSSPFASMTNGQLSTVLMELNKAQVLKLLPRNYNGRFEGVPGVTLGTAQQISLNSEQGLPIQADGEFLGYTPAQVRIFPQAIRFVVT